MITSLPKNHPIPYDLLLLADETKEAIDRYIHQSSIFIYQVESTTIGVCAVNVENATTVEIKNVAVHEHHQGNGIGTKLIQHSIHQAKKEGYACVWIGTGDGSIHQLKLYQRLGFEMFDIKKRFFLENYPEPIFENGIQLKHMVMLKMDI